MPRRRRYFRTEEEFRTAEAQELARQREQEHKEYLRAKRNERKRKLLALINTPRKCLGDTRTGKLCSRPSLPGLTFCADHGGDTAMAQAAARMRLMLLIEPATKVLQICMASEDESIALRAAMAILDRTGHGPKATIAHEKVENDDLKNKELDQLTSEADFLARRLQQRRMLEAAKKELEEQANTIDGVVIKADEDEEQQEPQENSHESVH